MAAEPSSGSLEEIVEENRIPKDLREQTIFENESLAVSLMWYGAAEEVAGSKILVKASFSNGSEEIIGIDMGSRFVPSGPFQRMDANVPDSYPMPDALLLTHAHADHVSAVKDLVMRCGYRGPIYMTHPTYSICKYNQFAFLDDHETKARHYKFLELFGKQKQRYGYREEFPVTNSGNIKAEFWNAGHMIGSASISLTITDPVTKEDYKILFSGDVGRPANWSRYLVPEPDLSELQPVDLVVMEATYGNKQHHRFYEDGEHIDVLDCLENIIDHSVENGIPVMFTGFSLRLHRLYLDAIRLREEKDEEGKPRIPEWYPFLLDSPTAEIAIARMTKYVRTALDDEYAQKVIDDNNLSMSLEEIQESCAQYFDKGVEDLFLDENGKYEKADNPFRFKSLRRTSRPDHDGLMEIIKAAYDDDEDEPASIPAKAAPLVKWLNKRYAAMDEDSQEKLRQVETNCGSATIGAVCSSGSSGMLSMGRMSESAMELLPLEDMVFVLSGYQAPGTPGHQMWEKRASREKKDEWKAGGMDPRTIWSYEDRDPDATITFNINNRVVTVPFRAQVVRIWGHGGHGDGPDMLDNWLGQIKYRPNRGPKTVFLNHMNKEDGEERRQLLEDKGYNAIVAQPEKPYKVTNLLPAQED